MMSYAWIKALHLLSVFAWMAGMLYLPRLFVYHADATKGSELSETLKIMERRLLRGIINPAMIASYAFGIWLLMRNPGLLHEGFMHVKLLMIVFMQVVHGFCVVARKKFAADKNERSSRFYRILNEVPAVLLVVIVVMIIVRPIF